MFMTGPLNGLPAPCTARLTVVTRSASTFPKSNPNTTGICHTNTGGRWTPELKFAGYDAVIVTGASSEPVGIVIEDDKVRLVDAGRYWGMGNYDLQNAWIKIWAGSTRASTAVRPVRTWSATPTS
jgi:aldehyde:ferredoxin oxidoreductase